jgi:N-carbamoyl-L-amino-acid hydrolase
MVRIVEKFRPNLDRITRDIFKMSEFISSKESGYTRIAFSEEDRKARDHLASLMEREANLSIRTDPAGNLIGRRDGIKQTPHVLVGSHIDTVRGGGRFDGVAGVIAGLEIARVFEENRIKNIHPLEVVVFLAEEPSPFGISTVGSRAMAGKLSQDLLESLMDASGRTLGMAIGEMGGDPDKILEAKISPNSLLANFELHIEQGPHLFSLGLPIGVVTGISGIYRGEIEVTGKSDHSGTTPMSYRKDALTAASEVILALERICRRVDDVVGNIGRIEVSPNSLNVVPGKVILGMELRGLSEAKIEETSSHFESAIDDIEDERGIGICFELKTSSKPVIFNSNMVELLGGVCHRLNIPHRKMPSWAGHDASHMAQLAPTGMIFVPSRDGRSHCSEEWTEIEHIALGTEVLAWAIATADKEGIV